jgi:hypothetical protein
LKQATGRCAHLAPYWQNNRAGRIIGQSVMLKNYTKTADFWSKSNHYNRHATFTLAGRRVGVTQRSASDEQKFIAYIPKDMR